jgi:hypothetical protein
MFCVLCNDYNVNGNKEQKPHTFFILYERIGSVQIHGPISSKLFVFPSFQKYRFSLGLECFELQLALNYINLASLDTWTCMRPQWPPIERLVSVSIHP